MHLHHVKIKKTTLILLINKDIGMHVNTIVAERLHQMRQLDLEFWCSDNIQLVAPLFLILDRDTELSAKDSTSLSLGVVSSILRVILFTAALSTTGSPRKAYNSSVSLLRSILHQRDQSLRRK